MSRPGTAQDNVMLLVEKVGSVARVDGHRLKAIPPPKHGARPLPDTAHLGLPSEVTAVGRDRDGVPVLEADVGAVEIDEEAGFRRGARRASIDLDIAGRDRRGRFFDTVA